MKEEVKQYIKEARSQGYSDEAIMLAMRNSGWTDDQIIEAFSFLEFDDYQKNAEAAIKYPSFSEKTKEALMPAAVIVFSLLLAGLVLYVLYASEYASNEETREIEEAGAEI